jgi:type VI secretion system secreted protein VgrG
MEQSSSAAERPILFWPTGLQPETLTLVGMTGVEGVSELYRFDVELCAPVRTDIPFERVVGQRALISVRGPGATREIEGVVREFSVTGQDEDFAYYQAQLVPEFWLWTRRIRSRIFQRQTTIEILREVLTGLPVDFDLQGDYPARNYCVQYQESDFAFASRLMEEDGIRYFFRRRQVMLSDRPLQHSDTGMRPAFNPRPDAPGGRPVIRRFSRTQAIGIGQYTVRDYHPELPEQTLEASHKAPGPVVMGRHRHVLGNIPNMEIMIGRHPHVIENPANLEVFDYPAGHAPQFTGIGPNGQEQAGLGDVFPSAARLARIRMEAETAPCLTVRGEGNVAGLLPGQLFRMTGHPDGDLPYLVLRVHHEARVAGLRSGETPTLEYSNRFEGQPVALAYRPPRKTPRPIIAGPQTAVVVGLPDDTKPFLDRLGRVKVQFHWDRQGKDDARSSCWVRVSQVWAGKGWGAFFWPRPGHEVVVAFEGGDPDRPLIVGSVYNEVNQPPANPQAVPEVAGFKSHSFDGNINTDFNALVFYDQPGQERIHLHSQGDTIQTAESTRVLVSREPAADYYGAFRSPTVLAQGNATPSRNSNGGGATNSGAGGGSDEEPDLATRLSPAIPWISLGQGRYEEFGWTMLSRAQHIPAHGAYCFGPSVTSTLAGRAYSESLGIPSVRFEFDVASLATQGPYAKAAAMVLGGSLLVAAGDFPTILLALAYPLATGVVDTAFAQRVQQTYFGPIFEIARCRSYRFHGRPLFGSVDDTVPMLKSSLVEGARPVAKALALALLTAKTALGIVNHVLNKPGEKTSQAWNITQGLLNGIVLELLRCKLLQMEITAAMAQTVADDLKRGKIAATEAMWYQYYAGLNVDWFKPTRDMLGRAARSADLAAEDLKATMTLSNGKALDAGTIDQAQHTYGEFTFRGTTGVTIETPRFDVVVHASDHDGNINLNAVGGRADIKAAQVALIAGQDTLANKVGIVRATAEGVVIAHSQLVPRYERIALENGSITLSAGYVMGPAPVSLKLSGDSLVARCGINSINLRLDGISLECGASKIELTPTGIVISAPTVDITANLAMKLKSLQFENNSQAISQAGAPMQKLG